MEAVAASSGEIIGRGGWDRLHARPLMINLLLSHRMASVTVTVSHSLLVHALTTPSIYFSTPALGIVKVTKYLHFWGGFTHRNENEPEA